MAKLTCSMCGYTFESDEHSSCSGCPVQKGCQLVCCPVCGFEMVDPHQSVLARWAMKILERKQLPKTRQVGGRIR